MGNTQQHAKAIHTANDKMIIQLRSRSIIIHYGYKFSLTIGDLAMFPHGLSGLKLWESNVVLARFVVINNALFKGKKVLELGAGTGIGGIAVSKWTKCQSIAMSDSRQQVIHNMNKNCQRNSISNIVIFRLNLSQYQHFTNKYDILLCSQILRPTPISFQQIYNLFKHFLNPGGWVYIIMSDNIEKIDAFSGLVDSQDFQFKYQKLVDEEYYASPLLNKVQGFKQFQRLQQEDYYVVKMRKKQPVVQEKVILKKLPQLPQSKITDNKLQTPLNSKNLQKKQQQDSPIKKFIQYKQKDQYNIGQKQQEDKQKIQHIKQSQANQKIIQENEVRLQIEAKQLEQAKESEQNPIQERIQKQEKPQILQIKQENKQQSTIFQASQMQNAPVQIQEQKQAQKEVINLSQTAQIHDNMQKVNKEQRIQPLEPLQVEVPFHQQVESSHVTPILGNEHNHQEQQFIDAKEQQTEPQIQILTQSLTLQQKNQPAQTIAVSNVEQGSQIQPKKSSDKQSLKTILQLIEQPKEQLQTQTHSITLQETQQKDEQKGQEKAQDKLLQKDQIQPSTNEPKQSKNKKNKKKK